MSNQKQLTLSFLKNNYHPFSHFSERLLEKAGQTIRMFELRAGEKIDLRAMSPDDCLFVTSGRAAVNGLTVEAHDIDQQPLRFEPAALSASVLAEKDTIVCHADSDVINDYLALDELTTAESGEERDSLDCLVFLKGSRVFRKLPFEVIEDAAGKLQRVCVVLGQEVVRQDEKADSFYLIVEGEAEVWREELEDDEPQLVAILGQGDSFGEEALIIGGGRNATVRMRTDGELLKMDKPDFDALVSRPLVRSVKPEVARAMLDGGARMLDVRYEEEYQSSFVPGSTLIPLPDIRSYLDELDPDDDYLVMCAAGKRASAAAMLMQQHELKATVIEGGMRCWPYDTTREMDLELVLFDFCPFAQRAVITLNYTQTPHRLTYIDPDHKPDWFADVSPFGKVPVLRVDGKSNIFESSVINEFAAQVSASQMLPCDPVERTLCRSWIEFSSALYSGHNRMVSASDENAFNEAAKEFRKNLSLLEGQLSDSGPYFTGAHFSLVDSTYAPLFQRMDQLGKIIAFYDWNDYPKIRAWSLRLASLDAVQNSTQGSFDDIYRRFVRRRSKGGYVEKQVDTAR